MPSVNTFSHPLSDIKEAVASIFVGPEKQTNKKIQHPALSQLQGLSSYGTNPRQQPKGTGSNFLKPSFLFQKPV